METQPQGAQSQIHWPQLLSLAGLYASVIIGWIAYYNYQPILLAEFNLHEFTFTLFIIQGIILVITPPIAGALGDRFRRKTGHRLPIISAGISFAAMVFMSVAFTLFVDPEPSAFMSILLPVAISLWLLSMSIFTSPAISTVELFAPAEKLPSGMAVITLVSGLIYATEPLIVDIINAIGAPLTFAAGGVAVLLSGYFLRKNSKEIFDNLPKQGETTEKRKTGITDYSLVVVLGLAFGIISTLLFNIFPDRFELTMTSIFGEDVHGGAVTTVILALSALLSIPLGKATERLGLNLSVRISVIAVFFVTLGILVITNSYLMLILLVLFAVSFTAASVSSLPLALKEIDIRNKVLGVGLFYAAFEFPNSILEAVLVYRGDF